MANSFYRGEDNLVKNLNVPTGLDLESMCEKQVGAPGEPGRTLFRCYAQMTWFRLVHPKGEVETELIENDVMIALVRARVKDSDNQLLATGHGSATARDDGIHGFTLVETAETRAVRRALAFAGFGCQLNSVVDTEEDGLPTQPQSDIPTDTQSVGNAGPTPSPSPDPINGRTVMVNPNAEKTFEEPTTTEEKKAKGGRKSKKEKEKEPAPTEETPSGQTTPSEPEPTTAPKEIPEEPMEQAPESLETSEPAPVKQSSYEPDLLIAAEGRMEAYLQCPEMLEKGYGEIADPDAVFVNPTGKTTAFTNLQYAAAKAGLVEFPGIYKKVPAPVAETYEHHGATLQELVDLGEQDLILSLAERYRKENAFGYAAAVLCAEELTK